MISSGTNSDTHSFPARSHVLKTPRSSTEVNKHCSGSRQASLIACLALYSRTPLALPDTRMSQTRRVPSSLADHSHFASHCHPTAVTFMLWPSKMTNGVMV